MSDDGCSSKVLVDLDEIDGSLRPASEMRLKLDEGALDRYAEVLKTLDPVRLRWDPLKKVHWVEDGAHRITVAKRAGLPEVWATISNGSYEDAFRAASRANEKHGVPITNADKRHRVEMALKHPEMATWSSRRIAEVCGVSPDFASRLRPEHVSSDDTSPTRIDTKGRKQPARKRKKRKKPAPQAESSPEPEVAAPATPPPPETELPKPLSEPEPEPEPVAEPPAAPVAEPGPSPKPDPPPVDWRARSAEEEAAIEARYEAWPDFARSAFVVMLWRLASKLNERHPDVVFKTNVPFD